jgi:hypothetical protein
MKIGVRLSLIINIQAEMILQTLPMKAARYYYNDFNLP